MPLSVPTMMTASPTQLHHTSQCHHHHHHQCRHHHREHHRQQPHRDHQQQHELLQKEDQPLSQASVASSACDARPRACVSATAPGPPTCEGSAAGPDTDKTMRRPIVIGYSSNKKKQHQFFQGLAHFAASRTGGRFRLVPLPEMKEKGGGDDDDDDNDDGDEYSNCAPGTWHDDTIFAPTSSCSAGAVVVDTDSSISTRVESSLVPADQPGPSSVPASSCNVATRYDAILHKRTDDMAAIATCNDPDAWRRIRALKTVLSHNPQVIAVDAMAGIWKLIDRVSISSVVRTALNKCHVRHLAWATLVLGSSREHIEEQLAHLEFPIILKRRLACGTKASHEMVIVHDMTGIHAALSEVFSVPSKEMELVKTSTSEDVLGGSVHHSGAKVRTARSPCVGQPLCRQFNADDVVAQEFIPDHGGIVFKVYAVGDRVEVNPRSSITDSYYPRCLASTMAQSLQPRYYRFDSQNITKAHVRTTESACPPTPPANLTSGIVRALSAELDLTLLGIDLVYDVQSSVYAVVDVNYFPGYKSMEDAYPAILNHIEKLVCSKHETRMTNSRVMVMRGHSHEAVDDIKS